MNIPNIQIDKIIFGLIYVLLFVVAVGGVILFLAKKKRQKKEEEEQFKLTFLQIKVPSQSETEINVAEQFFSHLTSFRRKDWEALWNGQYRISFEIISNIDGIGFYVVVPTEISSSVEKQINAAYPEAEIDIINPREIWDRGKATAVAEFMVSGTSYYPIKTYEDMANDPMSAITSSMSKLNDQQAVALQYIITPSNGKWRTQGEGYVSGIKAKQNDPENSSKVNIDPEFLAGVEKKIKKPGFDVCIRAIALAEDSINAKSLMDSLFNAFDQFTAVQYNKFSRKSPPNGRKFISDFVYRRRAPFGITIPVIDYELKRTTSVFNTEELATIFHFPNIKVQTPNIIWLQARKSAAPTNLPTEGLYLGKNVFRGAEKNIYMLDKDRTRHFYIIGQTGTGKSEFMKSLAVQDIRNGNGLAFIDPHGSDIDDLLQKVPRERIDDVILFDVSDLERPLGLNILEAHSEEEKHMNINSFITLLKKLYDPNNQGIVGPKLERAIRNVMLTAMADPGATLVDVLRLLIDEDYAKTFMPKITDPMVKRYWIDEVANTSDFHKSETMGYFVSKFDRFVTDRTMRNVLGQPKSAIDFPKIMREKKILMVDLSKGKIGEENSNFLGLILVPKILTAALGRASLLGKEEFPDFFLYVDEFQNFATPDFATILSEARKYKLNLVVAHQFIDQLSDEIKEAIFGNVGTMTTFRVGPDDASYLEHQYEPIFTESDLINLPVGNCYTRLLVSGQPSAPFSMKVDWDSINETPKEQRVADAIRENSRNKYGVPREEIDAYINERSGLDNDADPLEAFQNKQQQPPATSRQPRNQPLRRPPPQQSVQPPLQVALPQQDTRSQARGAPPPQLPF